MIIKLSGNRHHNVDIKKGIYLRFHEWDFNSMTNYRLLVNKRGWDTVGELKHGHLFSDIYHLR